MRQYQQIQQNQYYQSQSDKVQRVYHPSLSQTPQKTLYHQTQTKPNIIPQQRSNIIQPYQNQFFQPKQQIQSPNNLQRQQLYQSQIYQVPCQQKNDVQYQDLNELIKNIKNYKMKFSQVRQNEDNIEQYYNKQKEKNYNSQFDNEQEQKNNQKYNYDEQNNDDQNYEQNHDDQNHDDQNHEQNDEQFDDDEMGDIEEGQDQRYKSKDYITKEPKFINSIQSQQSVEYTKQFTFQNNEDEQYIQNKIVTFDKSHLNQNQIKIVNILDQIQLCQENLNQKQQTAIHQISYRIYNYIQMTNEQDSRFNILQDLQQIVDLIKQDYRKDLYKLLYNLQKVEYKFQEYIDQQL